MNGRGEKYKISGMMIFSVIFVFAILAAVTCAFEMVQKRQERLISTAKNTSQNETTMEIQNETEESQEQLTDEVSQEVYEAESVLIEEVADSENEEVEMVYLIKGDSKGFNKYARVDRLSYTDTIRYTEEQLACLDTYGLRITRNEIYARHGRMFNDQEMQEFFTNQSWYVLQSASGDFDEDCLNEVERYNSELIRSVELKQWN